MPAIPSAGNPRVAFIAGFERCMSTALASYLNDNGYCRFLVEGAKEAKLATFAPREIRRIVARRSAACGNRILLDASVNYVTSPQALRTIRDSVLDYRVILCLRNQAQRTISAYKYYQAYYTLRLEDENEHSRRRFAAAAPHLVADPELERSFLAVTTRKYLDAFGVLPDVMLQGDPRIWLEANGGAALAFALKPPQGKYMFSALHAFENALDGGDWAEIAEIDRAVELFAQQSVSERVSYELRFHRRHGRFPPVSVLVNSVYSYHVHQALGILDPRRVLIVSAERLAGAEAFDSKMREFLGVCEPDGPAAPLRRVNDTALHETALDERHKALALSVLREFFKVDSDRLVRTVQAVPGLDLSLFAAEELCQ